MENKPAVTALKEFCSKSSKNTPIYDFIIGREGGYICKVKALEMESHGNGRTKREAKQLAAENLWRKLSVHPGVSTEIQILNRDMLKELRDYCLLHGMPQPIIKAVPQSSSSSSAQDFVASCSVGSIKCYAKADKKKYARQLAASEVLALISNQMPDANVEMTRDFGDTMLETKKCFNAFKELTDTGSVNIKAVRLCDRHNYFKRFCPALKEAAFEVIRSDEYANTKDKALSLMSALKLTPNIGTVDSTSEEPLLKVDLNCEFDCLFLGMESKIYGQIIQYFKDMLV